MLQTIPRAASLVETTMTVEAITPARASDYLADAGTNRTVRQGKINQYARDMEAGRWHTSVIRFDDQGKLVDGQHRLQAIMVSGTTQAFYVERGLPQDAVKTIDSGLVRTVSDVLGLRGEPNAKTLSGALRYARWFDVFPGRAPSGQSGQPFSVDEVVEYLEANRGIAESVRMSKELIKRIPYSSGSVAAAIHYLGGKASQRKAHEFWRQMHTGAEMQTGSGPYLLRTQIVADRMKRPGDRMNINTLSALTIKAWNLWLADKNARQLRWVKGPQQQEGFPAMGARPDKEDLED